MPELDPEPCPICGHGLRQEWPHGHAPPFHDCIAACCDRCGFYWSPDLNCTFEDGVRLWLGQLVRQKTFDLFSK